MNKLYNGVEKYGLFYLRDPYYIEELPKDQQLFYRSEGEYEHEVITLTKLALTSCSHSYYLCFVK